MNKLRRERVQGYGPSADGHVRSIIARRECCSRVKHTRDFPNVTP